MQSKKFKRIIAILITIMMVLPMLPAITLPVSAAPATDMFDVNLRGPGSAEKSSSGVAESSWEYGGHTH